MIADSLYCAPRLAVFDVCFTDGLTLVEMAEGVTEDEVRQKPEADFPSQRAPESDYFVSGVKYLDIGGI